MSKPNPSTHKPHARRRKMLVYPSFQLTLFFTNTVILVCAFSAVGLMTSFSFRKMRSHGVADILAPGPEFFRFLEFQERLVYLHLGAALVIAFAFAWIVTLIVSHRMAGPLYRLREHFRRLADDGKVPPLDFRADDYFTEIPPIVNRAVARMGALNEKPHKSQDPNPDNSEAA